LCTGALRGGRRLSRLLGARRPLLLALLLPLLLPLLPREPCREAEPGRRRRRFRNCPGSCRSGLRRVAPPSWAACCPDIQNW